MRFINSNIEPKYDVARSISRLVQPIIITIPVFIILNYFITGGNNFLIFILLCLLFATFLPFTAVLMWIKNKNLDFDITNKDERTFPLLFGVVSYLIGVIMLFIAGAPAAVTVLMFCYFSNALLTIFITRFWKISLHSMGVAGPTAAMIYVFGTPGILFVFPLLMVMWSRIYLNKHTLAQVVVGAISGFVFTWLQFKIFLA
ncbi:PAP2 family protein [Methanobacterium sp.]|uniref:PAP2 family protein n=1 Tax=Methanobacterium sp. TaxID=2164 RepID=UPI003C70C487